MKLKMYNNHAVADYDGSLYIVDTGSPVSFRFDRADSIQINGLAFELSAPVCRKESLDKLAGTNVSGLIGMNVIAKTGLTIDLENGTLDFSADRRSVPDETEAVISFDLFGGYDIVTSDVCLNTPLKNAILDTGAPVPYISGRLISGLTPTGEHYEDFSPSFGSLSGEYLRGELSVPETALSRSVKFGRMPQVLDMFGMFDAILGITALTDKKVVFDFDRKEIRIKL